MFINVIRTRRGHEWSVPTMLLGVSHFYAAAICIMIIDDGVLGWLHPMALLFVWNAIEFL